jgi:peptidoglycan/xylan/chitin deacetylase (PgdA/CDA1 family)
MRASFVARGRVGRRHSGHVLVLAVHNVVPDEAPPVGEGTVHMGRTTFRRIVEWLLRCCDPVALHDIDPEEQSARPRFAVTFDDAYRGTITLALPDLVRLGVPATVFVPTAFVGDRDFWWDALADPKRGLDPNIREHVLNELEGDDRAAREWARSKGYAIRRVPPLWRCATLDELQRAASSPGISLACHSANHLALDRLSSDALRHELLEPIRWFETHGLPFERVLAYPYGFSTPLVQREAGKAGYQSAWLAEGGWSCSPADPPHARPRLSVRADAAVRATVLRIAEL